LRFELTASKEEEVEDNRFRNQYRLPLNSTTMDNTLIKQGDKQQQITVDYTNPITEESNVESGYDGSNINTIFTLTKTTMLQTTMNFRSARLTPQGKVYPNFVFNTGLRQEVFNKKLVVTLTTSDLFKTLKQKTELNSSFLKQTVISRRDAQIFYLGLSYRFGAAIKKLEEKLQFDDSL
jgi:hypothetical protein